MEINVVKSALNIASSGARALARLASGEHAAASSRDHLPDQPAVHGCQSFEFVELIDVSLQAVAKKYPGDFDRMRRMSIVEEADSVSEGVEPRIGGERYH